MPLSSIPTSRLQLNCIRNGSWKSYVQCHIHKGFPIILILSQINQVPRIDNLLRSITILSSYLRLLLPEVQFPVGLPAHFERTTNLFHSGYMTCSCLSSRLNLPGNIRWKFQTIKFLIVEPSPLSILIPLGRKYSP